MCGQAEKFTLEIQQHWLQDQPSIYFIHPSIHLLYLLVFVRLLLADNFLKSLINCMCQMSDTSFCSPLCFSQFHYEFWRSVNICWALTLFFSNSWVAMVTLCLRPSDPVQMRKVPYISTLNPSASVSVEGRPRHVKRLSEAIDCKSLRCWIFDQLCWSTYIYDLGSFIHHLWQRTPKVSTQLHRSCSLNVEIRSDVALLLLEVVSKSLSLSVEIRPSVWSQQWLLRPQWEN